MAAIVRRFVAHGHSLKAWRVGGLSPVKQTKGITPVSKGLWAFPFGAYDAFYTAGNFKQFGTRRRTFWVDGPFYGRFDGNGEILGGGGTGGWYLWNDAEAFRKMATRKCFIDMAYHRAKSGWIGGVDTEEVLEIFIPSTTRISG